MSEFTTLASLLALFNRETRPDLFGARKRGSTSEMGLEDLSNRPAVEFTPNVGAVAVARYFRVETPEINGRLGAVALSDLAPEDLSLLRARHVENHGTELYLDRPESEADLPAVGFVTVILGPINDAGDLGPWTWFPGEPTGASLPESEQGDPQKILAVKLHNG